MDLDDWFKPWSGLTSTAPWHASLDQWWRSTQGQATTSNYDVFEKIVAQSKSFYRLAEELGKSADNSAPTADWQRGLDEVFSAIRKTFGSDTGFNTGIWKAPLDAWQRVASDNAFSYESKLGELLQPLFSMPGIGYSREQQEQQQKYARCLVDYQDAFKNFTNAYLEINNLSLDRMRARLVEHMEQKRTPISTIRELYDIWVDCGEEVYGEYVMSEQYVRQHADLVNAQMRLKQQSCAMVEDFSKHLNIPTREEVDTLHARYKLMQSELANLKQVNLKLVAEVNELAMSTKGSTKSSRAKPQPKPRSKPVKTGAKKKTTTKKKKTTVSRARP